MDTPRQRDLFTQDLNATGGTYDKARWSLLSPILCLAIHLMCLHVPPALLGGSGYRGLTKSDGFQCWQRNERTSSPEKMTTVKFGIHRLVNCLRVPIYAAAIWFRSYFYRGLLLYRFRVILILSQLSLRRPFGGIPEIHRDEECNAQHH